MSFTPSLRTSQIVVEPIRDEIALHDARNGHFHTLNPTAANIWRAIDGETPVDRIAANLALPVELVDVTVAEFSELGLLQQATGVPMPNRRAVVKRLMAAGLLGGVLLPSIGSITGADSASAASDDPCVLDPCGSGLACPGFCQACLGVGSFCADCLPADNIAYCTVCPLEDACVVVP